jgi:hypothetical protein
MREMRVKQLDYLGIVAGMYRDPLSAISIGGFGEFFVGWQSGPPTLGRDGPVEGSDGDDDRSSRMPCSDMIERFSGPA